MVRNAIFANRYKATALRQLCGLLFCMLLAPLSWGKEYQVIIIKSGDSAIYNTVADGIRTQINEEKPNLAEFNIIEYRTTQDETVRDKVKKADIIISIGLSATQSALASSSKTLVLATLIPRQAFNNLIDKTNRTVEDKKRVGAIYLDPLPDRELALAKYIFGAKKRLSLVTSSPESQHIAYIKRTAKIFRLNLAVETLSSEENLIKKLSTVLVSSDVLIADPDPLIFNRNTARSILLTSYRHRVPVIGYSDSYVKAGALAAVYTTPDQVAKHTGEVASIILDGVAPGRYYSKYFNISFNYNVARSLGIQLPDEEDTKSKIQRITGADQ